jgi:hypothetical protein
MRTALAVRVVLAIALFLFLTAPAHAGGPAFIAGSGYDAGVEGQPLLWPNASVQYYTDQGALSPILTNAQADALVAAAITPWTTAPGVGFTATQAGHLAEDVNGSNIQVTNGVITAPADITPSATTSPLGIVYDYDGTVTDALLGDGAGASDQCFINAVYGGPDNFSPSGNIVHALAVINGVCATANSQLPDVQYRLTRIVAHVFGLGWSQANLNVLTRDPPPTTADLQGFPLMHFHDPISCVPITICYGGIFGGALGGNTITPALDDVTAFAFLYPASSGNPQPTGGLWGSVYFTNSFDNAAQAMQGVNVVARLMVNGSPSRQYVVSSVSGHTFVGNAGNIITGYMDADGVPFNRFGSSAAAVEGTYNLGQLPIPTGQTSAQYQLSVEAVDPGWSTGVGSYAPMQVAPSGVFAPMLVTVTSGSTAPQDILMLASEIAETGPGSGSTYQTPALLPQGGAWGSWISGYGSADFFQFNAQANRTASVAVTALDESGNPTEVKLQPVIGIWQLSDQSGDPAPASTASPFNSLTFGMTRLDAQFGTSGAFRLGVADYRGDGRPDYFYQASLLYSDTLTPARLSVAGGVTTLAGIGFQQGLQVTANGNNGTVLTQSASVMQVALPPGAQDGVATVQVMDPVTGSFSQMIGALTYGAAPTDQLFLLQGNGQSSPVGAQAPTMIRVRVTASDGITPVNGATIAWSATNGVNFFACNGATSCSVLTDESGEASTWVTPTAAAAATITAQLAPASYSPAESQQASLVGTETALDLAALTPTYSVARGATLSIPLMVEALIAGQPQPNVTVEFTVVNGSASLSSNAGITNASGLAGVTVQLVSLSGTVQVSACVLPANNPCQTFTMLVIASSSWTLEPFSGTAQVVPNGQLFQPLVVRVTDGSAADNPVLGVPITFLTTLARSTPSPGPGPSTGDGSPGESSAAAQGTQVILGTSPPQVVVTGQDGLASITPTVGSLGPCNVFISVTAGSATDQFELQDVDPLLANQQQPQSNSPSRTSRTIAPVFAVAPAPPVAAPIAALFAVPQEAPAADPQPSACSGSSSDSSCDGSQDPILSGPAEQVPSTSESTVSARDAAHTKATPGAPLAPQPAPISTDPLAASPLEIGPADSPSPMPAVPAAPSAATLLDDKRTCRFSQQE